MAEKDDGAKDTGRGDSGIVAKAEPPKKPEELHNMQVPDGIRHHFNERPKQDKNAGTAKEREDPWKQARGGPSEQWQPAQWDGHAASARRP